MKLTTTASLTTTEVTIDPVLKTIKLNLAGNLSADGVSLRTLYAYLKLQWKASATLITYPFPMNAITDTKFDLVAGWDFKDTTSRNLVRDGGWALKNATDNLTSLEEWMNVNTVGPVATSDQIYYTQSGTAGSSVGTALPYAGATNTAIKIYGDATHGSIDYRSNFTCYVREQGKVYDQETIAGIGQTTLTYSSYFFPLENSLDAKISASDATIDGSAPYNAMSITYYGTAVTRTISGTAYNFNVVINANGATRYQVYEYVQRQLRKTTDIDAGTGTVLGKTAAPLLRFFGDTLITSTGVYIDNLAAAEGGFIDFYDTTGTKRNLPYQAAGTINFNDLLTNDADSIYRVYYTSSYGTASALLVKDSTGADLAGTASGKTSLLFSYDYDANVQGGRTPGTDVAITIVALGITTGTYSRTTATITRSINNRFYIAAGPERNYYAS